MPGDPDRDRDLELLLSRAARGDLLAMQVLLVAHHDRLHALARSQMSADLASCLEPEDLLQQTYVRVLQAGGFENRGKVAFFGWLRTILASVLTNAERALHAQRRDVRREVKGAERPSAYDALVGELADSLTPSRVAGRSETRAIVLAALAGLAPDHRQVLQLRFLEGRASADTAEVMGRSVEAVQMLTVRALRRLRESIRTLTLSWG